VGKRNCWEIMACGLGPGEDAEPTSRKVCPAARPGAFSGINDGQWRGRFCWALAETLCPGQPQGCVADRLRYCLGCEAMRVVGEEEGREFTVTPPWRERIDDFA